MIQADKICRSCIRKIINKEEINDIDFATTLEQNKFVML